MKPGLLRRAFKFTAATLAILLLVLAAAWAWNPALVLVAGFEIAGRLHRHAGDGNGDCTGQWSARIDAATPYLSPFFPETHAGYHVILLETAPQGRPAAWRLEGTVPQARHASIQLYDARSGVLLAAAGNRELGEPGQPFRVDIGFDPLTGASNTSTARLQIPPRIDSIALVWRTYLSLDRIAPTLRQIDAVSGQPMSDCRAAFIIPEPLTDSAEATARKAVFDAELAAQQARIAQGDPQPIRFAVRHAATLPWLANAEVVYAWAPLRRALGETAQIRVRPPAVTPARNAPLAYWSICLSGYRETSTAACLNGETLVADKDGMVTVTIGGDGANALPWGWFTGDRVLIVRQLYGNPERDFEGSLANWPDRAVLPPEAGLAGRYCGAC